MISLHNWLNNLVESFTFYGARAGGGGTFGGGKPFNPMQQQTQPMFAGGGRPFNPQANQNTPYLMNFGDGRFPQGMPPMPQGLPPMQPGMNQPQGLPMQGGLFAGGGRPFNPQANQNTPYLINNKIPPNFTSQGQPEGRPFNPQALQNNPYLTNYDRPPQGISQPQGLPMQDGLFAGGGRPFNPQANQNNPYLINNKPTPNFTSQRQPMQGLMQGVPFK